MPYNNEIDTRVEEIIFSWQNRNKKKMFGGICHLLNGNMFCGVYKDFLILRLGEPLAQTALKQKGVREFDITGRPMKGWVMLEQSAIGNENELRIWLEKAKDFVNSLPAK